MSSGRKKFYTILSLTCLGGYIWLIFSLLSYKSGRVGNLDLCLFKNVTDIPCPSCGSTRSVIALTHADFRGAALLNPMGFIIAFVMAVSPFWLLFDLAFKKDSFYKFYCRIEEYLRKPFIAVPLVALVVINWIWNISKGL